jgi:CcmD family protein
MNMVALAYGFIWLAVFAYVVMVGRRLGRLHSEMDELQRRIDRLRSDGR